MRFDIAEAYEKGLYSDIADCFEEYPSAEYTERELGLILRSANKTDRDVWKLIGSRIQVNTELLWNRIRHTDFDEGRFEETFARIIKEGRDELVEDAVIMYLDQSGELPMFDNQLEFLADNMNKPSVKKYFSMLDNMKPMFRLIMMLHSNEDPESVLEELDKGRGYVTKAFDMSLRNGLNSGNLNTFISMLGFMPGTYVITERDIFRLKSYDALRDAFIAEDKTGKKREFSTEKILSGTEPIHGNDFRIYKFFNPEGAKELEPCTLVKLIIKYKGGAIDDNVLKTELLHIYGAQSGRWITKNREALSECDELDVIFGKVCRYMIAEGGGIGQHIKRIKDNAKIRDYLSDAAQKKTFSEEEADTIRKAAADIQNPYSSEIMYIVTGDRKYAADVENPADIQQVRDMAFRSEILVHLAEKDNPEIVEMLNYLDTAGVEKVYAASGDKLKKEILDRAEKSFALQKDLKLIEWYITYHVNDNLIHFDKYNAFMKASEIGMNVFMNSKSNDYISFCRKLYSNEGRKIIDLMHEVSIEQAGKIHDVLFSVNFINEYQRDIIRQNVYRDFPELRRIDKKEYDLSTPAGITRKQKELEHLTGVELPELSEVIKEAASHGDLKENAEYKYARQQYQFLSKRADELKGELSKAQPINMSTVSGNVIEPGVIVTLKEIKTGSIIKYSLLGPLDVSDDESVISYKSPLAVSLKGMAKGQSNENYEIVEIEKYKENE